MTLVGFHYEPINLDVNKICFEEEHDIPNTPEKSRKSQSITEWCIYMWEMRHKYMNCSEVEALGYFQSSDIRYNDRNMVTKI